MSEPTRGQHMAWCKERALRELDAPGKGESAAVASAFASMFSDLQKHPETQNHPAHDLGMRLLVNGHLSTRAKMREFIEGYN